MKTLAVIPARGGSMELRRKNLLPDANGVPLVLASARAARDAGCHVVVSTDDLEIHNLATLDGHTALWRRDELTDGPVDRVVEDVAREVRREHSIMLVQPTVQPITAAILRWFIDDAEASRQPTAMGVEARHLMWHDGHLLTDRSERQERETWPVREMGVRWWPGSPLQPPTRVIVAPSDLVDIDDADDYRRIDHRLAIRFSVEASNRTGMGHLHRVLTLAEGLQHHDISIVPTSDSDAWASTMIEERGWSTDDYLFPDVAVYDRLDNPAVGVGYPTVALEDTIGLATVTINALYGDGDYHGAKYAVLRPEFTVAPYSVRDEAKRVMVMFGGTDPAGFTDRVAGLFPDIEIDVVLPGQKRSVARAMHDADLLITSGGRTVFEAAAVGVPTVVMCQNQRETTHTHLGRGNIDLGDGRLVTDETLTDTVYRTLDSVELRRDLSAHATVSIDGRGADRVRSIIEHVGYYGEKP